MIRLLKLGIPITLGSAAVSIVTLIDTNLVMSQLKNIFSQIDAGTLTAVGGSGIPGPNLWTSSMPLSRPPRKRC